MMWRTSETESGTYPDLIRAEDVSSLNPGSRPLVEEGNKDAPTFSRIFKEMILVTDGGRPMLRVAKGTVAKKATLKIYAPEIEAL